MSSRRTAKLIFYRDLLKSLFAKYTKIIIIYDFDLAGVTGANKLRKRFRQVFVKFVSTKRMTINGKLKLLIKISQTSQ
jgi:5S rRNA maturation endonuclease (ribonuclease M5)